MALSCAVLLLLGLATSAIAGPVNSRYTTNTQCAGYCPENTKFGFEPSKTYEYDFESAVKTHIPGASSDHSSLRMRAVAKLEVLSRCEMALRLQSVSLEDFAPGSNTATSAERSSAFAMALERHPLRFAFISGKLENICPGQPEETWVLNIKRGILSHLQNTMNDFHLDFRSREMDVTGDCPVTYKTGSAGWKGIFTITKSKDMQACASRLSADTVLQGTAYRTPSKMQSLPVMKGTHECKQKIDSQGVLQESACFESHVFRPFSKGSSGATTDVSTQLTFKRAIPGIVSTEECGEARPITFDHETPKEEVRRSRTRVESVLRELCAQTTPGVKAQAPALFGKLVRELQELDTENLVSLHTSLASGGFCKHAEKYLHDAVPNIGNVASARLIKNLVLSGEVTGAELSLWLNSLAFVQKPSAAMLTELTPLVTSTPLHRQAALAVSSLVNNYCRTTDCSSSAEVRAIADAFGAHLVRGCEKASREHDLVIMSLKALGNMGHGNTEVLNACIGNAALDTETRVTAVYAFRRMSCSADKSELIRTFENDQLDSELRIAAYLSLMACPTTDIVNRVRNMLENEEVNQVGSYVWTHLTNLLETSSPLKQEIRQIIEKESLRKEFDMDKRKFSRNIEKSYFSELFNSGASAESNIVFSPDSFVPRAASVNLTVDLFGHSVNLVEVGGRVEGLNSILDKYFDDNAPADASSKETTRDINNIDKKYGLERESEPKGSAYFRVFGNEIAYADFHDLDASTVREKFNYLNWLIELAKEHSIDVSKSFQYLDTTVTVATIAGFPLRLRIQGNGVTDIKLKGKLDLRNLAAAPRSLNVEGSIAPSAALEIMAEMGIDAYATRTGLRTVDTLHTSTVADVSVQLREGKIFSMDVKMPRDTMEIFSAKHDLFVVYRGQARPLNTPATKIVYNKCLSGTFTSATGLEMCANVAIPDSPSTPRGPYVPLTTSGVVAVVLHKRDSFTGYHFEARALREKVSHEGHMDTVDVARISFNTPGSRVGRELTMDFKLNHSSKKVDFSLVTPWMPRASFNGALINTEAMKQAVAEARLGSTVYEATAEMSILTNKYNTRYLPKFEIKLPGGTTPTVSGTILYRPGRKMDVDMNAVDIFSENVNVKGSITGTDTTNKQRYETALDIKSPLLKGKVDGFIDRSEKDGVTYSSRLQVNYKPAGSVANRFTFSGKLRDKNTDKRTEMSGTAAFNSDLWPSYDTDTKFSVVQQGKTLTTSFEGSLANSAEKTLKIEQTGLLNMAGYNKKANFGVDVSLPYLNINHKLSLAHLYKKDALQSSATLTKAGRPHSLLEIDISRESVKPLKANAEVKLHYPGRQMMYRQKIEETETKEYKNELIVQLEEDQTIRLTADYKMLPRHELEAQLTSPFTSPISFTGHLNPVLRDFDIKASLEHRARRFSAQATTNLKLNNKRIGMELVIPSKTITAIGQMKRDGKVVSGLFETKWDAVRDANKKFRLTGEVTLAKYKPSLTFNAEMFPEKFIEVIANGKLNYKPSAASHEGDLTFRSSFAKFEEITASFKHNSNPSKVAASGQLTWAPGSKIDGDLTLNLRNGWSSVDVLAKLNTPFTAVRRIRYDLDYAIEGSTFRANTKGTFNQHNVGFAVSCLAELPRMEGSVTMTSSFSDFEKIVLKATHVDTGRKCHSDAELTWADNQKIRVDFNMDHARSGYHLNNNGDLQVTTPFKDYRKNKITWMHSNDDNSVKQRTEIEMFKKKAVYDFDGSLIASGANRKFDINTFITGPDVNTKLTVRHEHNTANLQGVKTSALVQWATGRSMQITNEFSMDASRLQESFKFMSPFSGFETVTLELDNTMTENGITIKNELKWPENTISLDGQITRKSYEYDGNLQLVTPFMPTQKMTFINEIEGNKYTTKKTYEYAPGDVITMTTSWDYGRKKAYSLEFTSPCPYLERVNYNVEYSGTLRDFTLDADFFHNLMADKVQLKVRADTSDLSDLKTNFNLKTPIRSLSNLRMMYSHKLEGNDLTATGSFQMPQYKFTFNHGSTFVNWRQFNTKSSIVFKPGQKMELTTRFNARRTINGAITFTSPFKNMEELGFTFNHEGPMENMKSTFEATISNNRKITGSFEFDKTANIRTVGAVTTPFIGYKSIGFTVNHEGSLTDMKSEWSAYLEGKRIGGQSSFFLKGNRLNMRSSLALPEDKNIVLSYEHEGTLDNFNCEGTFEYPNNKFILKNNFRLISDGMFGKVEIRTPFKSFRKFIIEAKHDGLLQDFKNSLSILYNNDKYEGSSNFKFAQGAVIGKASLLLPEEYSINFRHNGDKTNFNNNMVVKFNGQQVSGQSSFKLLGNNIEGSIEVLTPFEGYRKFSFIGNHQGPMTNFRCDYTLELGSRRMTISDEFKLEGNELSAKLDISTPYAVMKNFNFECDHEGPMLNFKNKCSMKINNKRYTTESELETSSDSISGKAILTLPEEYSISFRHSGPVTDFSNNFEVKANTRTISGNSEFKWNEGVELSATLNTPFSKVGRIDLKYSHDGEPTNFQQEATLIHAGSTYFTKTKFEKKAQKVQADFELRTPFEMMRTLNIEASHTGKNFKNFKNSIDVIHNGLKRSAGTEFKWFSNILKAKATASLPEDYMFMLKNTESNTGFETDLKITSPESKIDGSCNFDMTETAITGSFALTTPFHYFTSQSGAFELKTTANGYSSKLHIRTDLPAVKSLEAIFNHEGPYSNFRTDGSLNIDSQKMAFSINHRGRWNDFSTSSSLTINGETGSMEVVFKKAGNTISSTGTLTTPFANYERFAYTFNHGGNLNDLLTTGKLETPLRTAEFSFSHKGNLRNFETEVEAECAGKKYGGDLKFKLEEGSLETVLSIETPYRKYNKFGVNVNHQKDARGVRSSVNIETPFEGYKKMGAEFTFEGTTSNLHTTVTVTGPAHPIKLDLTHKGDWSAFTTEGSLEVNNRRYTTSHDFKYANKNVDLSCSWDLPMGRYAYSLEHKNTERGFTTKGSLQTPHEHYERASFDLTHEGTLNNFATSGKINPFNGEGSFRVNHRGTLNDFTSSAEAGWNGDMINGNVVFKKEDSNMNARATLTTPFTGYEKFQADAKHTQEGKKINTEVSIETPFEEYMDPSFTFDHRGHWKNFKTSVALTTPCKHMKPMTMNINHRGIPKDFTSAATFKYGRKAVNANARYQRTATGLIASADLSTPLKDAEKFGFTLNHQYNGRTLNTKGTIETPHREYKNFGLEINHEGDAGKFETTGKIETPFTEPINFEMNHEGRLVDFQSHGKVERNGEKIEGEVRYRKTPGMLEANHDGFLKISTPHAYLRTAEAVLAHTHDNGVWSGNMKGSYNQHKFDGDYSLSNKRSKSASLTLREPRPMRYTATVNPTAGTAESLINWDSSSPDSQLRFEGTLKNVKDVSKTDRQLTVSVTCPHRTRTLTTGYQLAADTVKANLEFQWDASIRNKFSQVIELNKNTRGRELIYDGSFKTTSPLVNFELKGSHKINPGRRYMTQVDLVTSETLQVRSDIKTTKGLADFSSTFTISHPSLTRDVVVGVDGKIDRENTLYDGKIDLEYAMEKITFTGKIADESNSYRTRMVVESSLKHPSNKVDMTFKSLYLNNRKTFKTDAEFTYLMSRTNTVKTMTGKVDFNKVTEEIKIDMVTPVKRLDMSGRRTINTGSRQHFSVKGSVDGQAMRAEVDIDDTIPGITTELNYAPGSSLHMNAKYASPDHFVMESYRQVSGSSGRISEASLDMEIVSGHLVKGRAFLRPDIVSDLSSLFSYDSGLGQLYDQVTDAIAEDLRLKVPGFKRAVEPALEALEAVSQHLGSVAQRLERSFNEWYGRNEYYFRSINNAISSFYRNIRANMDEGIAVVNNLIGHSQRLYRESALRYDEWRQAAVSRYNYHYQQAAAKMTEYRTAIHSKISDHALNLQGSLLDLFTAIRNNPRVKTMLDAMQAKAERVIARTTELADRLYDAADRLLSRPELSFIRQYITKANEKTAWLYEYLNLEEYGRQWLHKMRDTGLGPLRRSAVKMATDLLHLDETRIDIWAPQRGEVAGQIYLPLEMRDLRSMPSVNVRGYLDELKRHIPDTDWVLWDTLYAYKPSSNMRDWIPPFKSHATIAGNQHYVTFDKKFYEFAGECSYLLARDFIDGTFSVIVNYEARRGVSTKKSMTIVHGTDQVEILPDFRVELNGRRSELPVIGTHTAVYRVGNTLRIDNDHGVKITCNLPHDHCTVSVTGWYFGKTAGLLGTYDNEPSTDFTKITGERATTPEEFAHSWTAGKQCRAVNNANIEVVTPAHPKYDECARVFQAQTSAFRPCFKQMDPTPFMKMCMNGDMCNTASLYVHECKLQRVPIRMPRQCVTCQLPSGSRMSEGQEETLRGVSIPKKADVIFVVSHGECNHEAVLKMNQVATQILNSLKDKDVNDVNFGLVGYGGEGMEAEPHSHTMDGRLLNTKTTFLQTIGGFTTLNSNRPEDALAAIEFASRYAFRPGASKSIVLMPCSRCSTENVAYSTIQAALSEQDIKFHMLIHEDFKLSAYSKSPKTAYMYGIDRQNVYTNKDARGREVRGDRDLRRHTLAPKDLCVALTHESDGSVFNLLKLTETTVDKQKRFATVFGRVVAKKGEPADCQRCECRSDESGVGVTVCKPCQPATPYVYTWDMEDLPEPEVPFSKARSL